MRCWSLYCSLRVAFLSEMWGEVCVPLHLHMFYPFLFPFFTLELPSALLLMLLLVFLAYEWKRFRKYSYWALTIHLWGTKAIWVPDVFWKHSSKSICSSERYGAECLQIIQDPFFYRMFEAHRRSGCIFYFFLYKNNSPVDVSSVSALDRCSFRFERFVHWGIFTYTYNKSHTSLRTTLVGV